MIFTLIPFGKTIKKGPFSFLLALLLQLYTFLHVHVPLLSSAAVLNAYRNIGSYPRNTNLTSYYEHSWKSTLFILQ